MRDSGQFNYHLDKLCPGFVRKHEDGYELTHAGKQVIGAAVSGTYTETDVTVDAIDVSDCWQCEGRIELRYDRGYLIVECSDCEVVVTDGLAAPPVVAATHDGEELAEVFNQLLLDRLQTMHRGFCLLCGGVTEKSLGSDADVQNTDELLIHAECSACGNEWFSSVGTEILDHPGVVEFLYQHGIDIRKTPVWEYHWLAELDADILQEEPLRIQVVVELPDDRLELQLDDTFDVVEFERP